jgi:hypothetical protein
MAVTRPRQCNGQIRREAARRWFQDHDSVGELNRLLNVVGDINNRAPLLEHDTAIETGPVGGPTVQQHLAAGGTRAAGDDPQEGTFAAATGVQNAQQLVARYREIEVIQLVVPAALSSEEMVDIDGLDDGRPRRSRRLHQHRRTTRPASGHPQSFTV